MRFAALLLACLLFSLGNPAQSETFPGDIPLMQEEAEAAGIDQTYTGGFEHFVGGGAAGFDCNGDRRPDLLIAGGTSPFKLYVNESKIGGALAFREQSIDLRDKLKTGVTGAYPLDVDNDGFLDIVLLRIGENLILKGGKDCAFSAANQALGFDGGRSWTTAFAANFEPEAEHPTLAFGNYIDRSAKGNPWGACAENALYRSPPGDNPDYREPITLTPGYCVLSMLFTDWNRSDLPSLRVSNDREYYRGGEEQLWRIEPGKPPRLYKRADGWRHVEIWGMGIAEADLNADGFPEYALTSMGETKLQTLDEEAEDGRPIYRDIASERGAVADRPYAGEDHRPSTGWHAEFADFNNDARLDLFIAKGNVDLMPDFAAMDPDNLLLAGLDGKFTEVGEAAGLALPTKGRGAVVTDFNLDGMLDLLVVNREGKASLFRNLGGKTLEGARPMGNWLSIELQQRAANRKAIGAMISVKTGNLTQTRKIQIGGGHASGRLGFVHFGLGVAERAEVRIKWPGGEWSVPFRVFANNFIAIRRHPREEVVYWYPSDAPKP